MKPIPYELHIYVYEHIQTLPESIEKSLRIFLTHEVGHYKRRTEEGDVVFGDVLFDVKTKQTP